MYIQIYIIYIHIYYILYILYRKALLCYIIHAFVQASSIAKTRINSLEDTRPNASTGTHTCDPESTEIGSIEFDCSSGNVKRKIEIYF